MPLVQIKMLRMATALVVGGESARGLVLVVGELAAGVSTGTSVTTGAAVGDPPTTGSC